MNARTIICTAVAACAMILTTANAAKYIPGDKRVFSLYCNGVPCAVDSVGRSIYCPVKPVDGDSITVVFTSPMHDSVSINFNFIKMGDSVKFANKFSQNHRTFFSGTRTVWNLYFTTLPVVLLDATELEKDVRHPGYITIIDPWCRTDGVNNLFIHYAGVKIRGATAATYPKKPFGVELWDENNEETDATIMGMRSDGDVILDAMYIDKARMRNRLCFDLWNTVDRLPYNDDPDDNLNGTEGTFVEVLVNGEYNGLYCLTDKIDRKKLQLNKYKVDPASGEIAQHGMLYKATDWTGATQFNGYDTSASTQALNWLGWEQKYPDESNAFANWTPMINLIEYAAPDLYPNKTLFSALLERRFYVQNLVNYVLFLGVMHITDNSCKNTYISFRDVKASPSLALFTPWDMDASWGREWDGSMRDEQGFDKIMEDCGLFKRLINDNPADFHRRMHDTWIRWRNSSFSIDSVTARINAYSDLFTSSGAFLREMRKWPGTVVTINTETRYMLTWYKKSFDFINEFLKDYPTSIQSVTADNDMQISATTDGANIIVNGTTGNEAHIRIYDTAGTAVESTDAALPYRSGNLAPGIYIINISVDDTTVRKKVAVF